MKVKVKEEGRRRGEWMGVWRRALLLMHGRLKGGERFQCAPPFFHHHPSEASRTCDRRGKILRGHCVSLAGSAKKQNNKTLQQTGEQRGMLLPGNKQEFDTGIALCAGRGFGEDSDEHTHSHNEREGERETDARLWRAQTGTQHKALTKVTPSAREEEHGQNGAAAIMNAALYSLFLVRAGSKSNGPSTLLGGIFPRQNASKEASASARSTSRRV